MVALEQLLIAEKDKEEARQVIQSLEYYVDKQNSEILALQTRVRELEAAAAAALSCASQNRSRDVVELLEELNSRSLAGRSLAWLQKCEASARKLVDHLTAAASAMRRAVPDGFRCPITQDVMVDPVMVAETGHTYERSAIEQWLHTHNTDPKTNMQLTSKMLIPNHGLRATIEEFSANNGESGLSP